MSPDPRPRKKAVPDTKRTRTREGKDPALRIIFFQSLQTSPPADYTQKRSALCNLIMTFLNNKIRIIGLKMANTVEISSDYIVNL